MTNPVAIVRNTSQYGDDSVKWRTIWLWCPGCNSAKAIPIPAENGIVQPNGPSWTWDGNLEAPTLDPSILQYESGSVPRCHSFLKAGRWQFLSDCTHKLAGHTVDMMPLPDYIVNP